ncbi:MAG: alpha/beta hydrolase [Gammaproteobacteria bacterium]|nr:alpha/beta hydrolase [Gammaproteobacteria bacterium]
MQKPTLILMPGMDGSGFLYQPLSQLLTKQGLDNHIEPLNPHTDKYAYMDYLEDKYQGHKLALVAESYAGHIATQLAIRGNLQIEKLVIMASFLENPTKLTELEKYFSMSIIQSPPLPEKALAHALFGKTSETELLALFKQAMQDVSSEQLSQRISDMRSLELPIEKVHQSTLYIQASDDWLVPARNLTSYQKVFTNLTIEKVKATHLVAQGRAKKCCELIQQFL